MRTGARRRSSVNIPPLFIVMHQSIPSANIPPLLTRTFLKVIIRKLSLRAFFIVLKDHIFNIEQYKNKYRIELEKQKKLKIHDAEFLWASKSIYCALKTNAWHANEVVFNRPTNMTSDVVLEHCNKGL